MNATESTPEDEGLHLLDILIVLAKHSRMILAASGAATVLTYLILFCLPDQYTATVRIMPPQQNLTMSGQLMDMLGGGGSSSLTGGGGGSSPGGMASLLGLKSPADLYVGMLGGTGIADRIIERFNLRTLYKKKYIEGARKALNNEVRIKAGKDSLIIVEVTDKDRQRAANMANAYIEELDKLLQRVGVEEAQERLKFLEKERKQASVSLANIEDELRAFSEQNNILQIDVQTKGMLEYIANLRATIDTKEVQIAVMRKQATTLNYDLVRLDTELKMLKEKLRIAENQYEQTCAGDVSIATAKIPGIGLKYFRLYREVKFQEALYQLYTKMVELARLDTLNDVAVVHVVDKANPPERRSNQRALVALAVGAATFFLMILLAFLLEYVENCRQEAEEAQRLTVLTGYLQPYRQGFARVKNWIKFRRSS